MADHETSYYEQDDLWGRAGHDSDVEAMAVAVEQIMPRDVETVLDVGCGDGAVSDRLLGGRHVVGGDRAMAALRHVTFPSVQLTGEALPFSADSVDLVMCTDVIEHLDDELEQQTLAELIRVSRRYVLVAVPYSEPLRHFQVRCANCASIFHAHHHQRSYDLERFMALPGAAVDAWQLIGARWACTEPALSEMALLLGGSGYPFSWSVCPACGHHATGTTVAPDEALQRRRLEAAQYLLAETGERHWPTPSEILVLLSVERDDREAPRTSRTEASPPELPKGLIEPTPDRRRAAMESFPRDWYWVADGDRVVFVFPTRPGSVTVDGGEGVELGVYDHVSASYVPAAALPAGPASAFEIPVVSPDISGYRLAVDSATPDRLRIEVHPSRPLVGDALKIPFGVDRALSVAVAELEARRGEVHALAATVAESNTHANEIEARRSAAEQQLSVALEQLSQTEQARHQAEVRLSTANAELEDLGLRLAELNAHANEIEARRSATEAMLTAVNAAHASEMESWDATVTSLSEQVTALTVRIEQLKSDLESAVPIDSLPGFLRRRFG